MRKPKYKQQPEPPARTPEEQARTDNTIKAFLISRGLPEKSRLAEQNMQKQIILGKLF